VQNNPLKFIDPTGRDLYLTGNDADYIVAELERITGLKLDRDKLTGKVTIVPGSKRNMTRTSKWFANKLVQVIGDSGAVAKINTGRNQPNVFFDSFQHKELDVDDYDNFKKADPKFAAAALAHVIEEYYYYQIIPLFSGSNAGSELVPAGGPFGPLSPEEIFTRSHNEGSEFESKVISDFTGWWEQPGQRSAQHKVLTVEYSTVIYDITIKNSNVDKIYKYEKQKPRKN
jgi:hypothetical protein